jgi:hypothetical protein
MGAKNLQQDLDYNMRAHNMQHNPNSESSQPAT